MRFSELPTFPQLVRKTPKYNYNIFAVIMVGRNFSSSQQFLSRPLTTFSSRQVSLTLILFATLQSHPAARRRRHHNKIKTVESLETCLASRNTRRRHETRSRVVVAYVFTLVADSFEQRQIACRLTDNCINGCFSPSSSWSSSSSFSSSWFRFPARLFLKKVPRVVEEPPLHLRGTFASLLLLCLSVDVSSFSSRHPPSSHRTSGEW